MAPKVEVFDKTRLTLGEGPHWDAEAQALYYVDLPEGRIHKYDARTKKFTHVLVDEAKKSFVTLVVPVAGTTDQFVIGYNEQLALLTWDGVSPKPKKLEILVNPEPQTKNRFNDGKADSSGRLWAGTMAIERGESSSSDKKTGALYSLDVGGKSVKRKVTDIGISNGLAWSMDDKIFYYIDSGEYTVDAFDYDIHTGEIKNRRVIFDLKKNNIEGLPDGMTIDTEGKLWFATFSGSAVYQIDPNSGSVLQTIKLPASMITSVTWGGANLDELYVTCASINVQEDDQYAGRVFKVTGLGASGRAGVPVKL